jgi:hypothetical protein
MKISDYIRNDILLPRLKQSGVLVVYDPDRRYREIDTVGEHQAGERSSVKREWRVEASGISLSQSFNRLMFVATAIATFCKCVFA